MANPLTQAVDAALHANTRVGKLFSRIGTASSPRGFVQAAYRNASRAMRTALSEPNPELAAMDVMTSLRGTIRAEAISLFADADAQGADEAARQLRFYGIISNPNSVISPRTISATEALTARVDAQAAIIQALLLTGADVTQIVGSDTQAGILRPSDVSSLAAQIAAGFLWSSFGMWVTDYSQGQQFQKQAIAALDSRTTECCLRVHGQVQPLDGKFHLTGRPRFSDEMDWSPFHHFCRTAVALYLPEFDMGLTDQLTAGAQKILAERAAGLLTDRHPADAYG